MEEKEFNIGERVQGINGTLGLRKGTIVGKYRGRPSAIQPGHQFYDVQWDDRSTVSKYHMAIGLDKITGATNE